MARPDDAREGGGSTEIKSTALSILTALDGLQEIAGKIDNATVASLQAIGDTSSKATSVLKETLEKGLSGAKTSIQEGQKEALGAIQEELKKALDAIRSAKPILPVDNENVGKGDHKRNGSD